MISATADRLRRYLRRRHIAYNQVFTIESVFTQTVLKDLAKFCRAHESTFHTDARVSAVMDGRREVYLRIQEHLNLTTEQIYALHKVSERGDE